MTNTVAFVPKYSTLCGATQSPLMVSKPVTVSERPTVVVGGVVVSGVVVGGSVVGTTVVSGGVVAAGVVGGGLVAAGVVGGGVVATGVVGGGVVAWPPVLIQLTPLNTLTAPVAPDRGTPGVTLRSQG